ncbi:MAG TPA: nucleotide exchange factor GrpE [bacterium]
MSTDDKNQTPEEQNTLDNGAAELEVAKAEAADWRDKYLRKLAEFDNFRKRSRQELSSVRDLVGEELIVSLLPAIDDFDRLLQNPSISEEQYRRAVDMIYGKLRSYLDARGITKFECVGQPFDPALHDAMLMQPTPDFPAGTVLAVMTPGYKLGDRVIRHAQVIVSAEPALTAGADDGSSGESSNGQ